MAQAKNRRGTALSIKLPMDMAQAVYQQVREGHFDTAGGVVRAALRAMLNLDELGLPLTSDDEDPLAESPKTKRKKNKKERRQPDASRNDDDLD